jgi:hypothetical protein
VKVPRIALAALAAAALLLALADPASVAAAPKKKKAETTKEAPTNFDKSLPVLGTKLSEFPAGPMKGLADGSCLTCHSADIVVQQHLTEKQWAAEVSKMAGWGSPVPEDKKSELIAYLVTHFGPDNARWRPVVTRPVGR